MPDATPSYARYGIVPALAALLCATTAQADPIEDFYKGRTVTIVTSTGVGGPFDLTARALAKHMPKYLPGRPTMIVRNMPGGGNVLATNYMYTQAPKDGTALGVVNNIIPLHQVLDGRGVRFDARRFNWLGSTGGSNLFTWVWHTAGFKSMDDVMRRELITGSTGVGSGTFIYPNAMNMILRTRHRIVMGYSSTAALDLAMERGEVQGRGSALWTWWKTGRASWVAENKLNHLVQWGSQRDKELPDVPLLTELAKNEAERQVFQLLSSTVIVGRPILTTPEVPADRVAALKASFAKAMQDPDYIAAAKKANMEVNPMLADEMQKLIEAIIATPPEVVALAKAATTKGQDFDCKALVKDATLCEGKE
jgi:tripartite-type tricarboxylate transporter receptor subunit TctC